MIEYYYTLNEERITSLEERITSLEERITSLEERINNELTVSSNSLDAFEQALIEKIEQISIPSLIMLSLFLNREQTRLEIQRTLTNWGRAYGNWFRGGNFNNRLIKKSFVHSTTNNKYQLTKKGQVETKKMIKKYKLGVQ